ncbi:ABC transporter ATP-binding protein [Rhodobacter calidifons]|uniref:ATP-binding cassette domain-containing protein n=1 Tax=Rhodobacter calidifons TaxID=2715277 RepID=A0ABX0GCB2_9RHOB|nr:ABC transporter ATP-binding protein [Rhodobacter calidifons]NHB78532.1 ATP-binding cassette domain-containing protein [Rhodobacter calidifons]
MMSLAVENLSFAYGPRKALDGLSFTLDPGSFTALLGPNGAGKSTLFSLLTRLFTTPQGRITIAGQDLARAPLKALAALGVVFQQPTLDLNLTTRRNLLYYAALHGLSGTTARDRAEEVLATLSLEDRADTPARSLSGGQRRRVELARALIHRPQVLLLDEPTVGLDAASRRAITDHAHQLARDGTTVLWATHLTDEVSPTDRCLILHRGHLLADATAAALAEGTTLTDRFLALIGASA